MHFVDLGESFPRSIYLQILASIQPIASLVKFARSLCTDPPGRFQIASSVVSSSRCTFDCTASCGACEPSTVIKVLKNPFGLSEWVFKNLSINPIDWISP